MQKFILFILLFGVGVIIAQTEQNVLSASEKAYVFHTIHKAPIFEQNFGKYIVYTGKEYRLPNGELYLDKLEKNILQSPDSLVIYKYALGRASQGLLTDLAHKTALWKLNKSMMYSGIDSLSSEQDSIDFTRFEEHYISYLPQKAQQLKELNPSTFAIFRRISDPSLSFNDKVAMLNVFPQWTMVEKMEVFSAYNKAVNEWVNWKSKSIFEALGGQTELFESQMIAIGSGSKGGGDFKGREEKERGWLRRGLPDASGFFPYSARLVEQKQLENIPTEIKSKSDEEFTFETFGNARKTIVQLNVWGYDTEKQSTVVLQQGRSYYPLFGIKDSRFLSPDSTFKGGKTYYRLIEQVQRDLAEVDEKLYGKKGIDYWIKEYEKQRDDLKLQIDEASMGIGDIRREPIKTKTPNSKKLAKASREQNGPPILKTDKHRKPRTKAQNDVISLYGALEDVERTLKALRKEKEELVHKIQYLTGKLNDMYSLIGKEWVKYTVKDNLFTYEDGVQFDLSTQSFIFPETIDEKTFTVRLVGVSENYFSNDFNELMLHFSVTSVAPHADALWSNAWTNLFKEDSDQMQAVSLLAEIDSISLQAFFDALVAKKPKFSVQVNPFGIGNAHKGVLMADVKQEIKPSSSKDMEWDRVGVYLGRTFNLQVDCFTPSKESNYTSSDASLLKLQAKNKWNTHQLLTAARALKILGKISEEATEIAEQYLSPKEAKKALKVLEKGIKKVNY